MPTEKSGTRSGVLVLCAGIFFGVGITLIMGGTALPKGVTLALMVVQTICFIMLITLGISTLKNRVD
jgi:threonine/homoserine/homoserine lactone efflux protein